MASSRVTEIVPPTAPLKHTIERIELTLLILTDLILKYSRHTSADVWEVLVFLLRQVSDIQVAMIS
jgi:hypothetical protein